MKDRPQIADEIRRLAEDRWRQYRSDGYEPLGDAVIQFSEEIIRAVRTLDAEPGWQSIEVFGDAPQRIVGWCLFNSARGAEPRIVERRVKGGHWFSIPGNWVAKPTHGMVLPSPPRAATEEK